MRYRSDCRRQPLTLICDVVGYSLERYIVDEAACKERLAELELKLFGAG